MTTDGANHAPKPLPTPSRVLDHVTQPVLNRPHLEPSRYWELGEDNIATGEVIEGRRLSQALVIVPKQRGTQLRMQVTSAEQNELVNRIRDAVGAWRHSAYPGTTATTRHLLQHWRSETNEPRLFFAQVEAVETLIWLTEANASKYPVLAEVRRQLIDANNEYNDGIARWAVRMATGSGKTAVMGMMIAYHAANAASTRRRDSRYTTCFLAIAPGHTVRERLAVLQPTHQENVYDEMRLLPESMRACLGAVKIRVLNFHAFAPRDRLAVASSDAKKLFRVGSDKTEYESMDAVLQRILRGFPKGSGAPRVCVLNDEAHHCYLPEAGRRGADGDDDTKAAAIWFGALAGLRESQQLGPVYDFSATPIFIEGSERKERMFPWVVSDFPLMDSIESGLVKIPQVPIDDNTDAGDVKWRNLYRNTTPKKVRRDAVPAELKRALDALYSSYEQKYDLWMNPEDPKLRMPTPPVLIVVANNISNATAIADHISGWLEKQDDGTTECHNGAYPLLVNYSEGKPTEQMHTLLVHSQLEGEANLNKSVSSQAARLREPGDNRDDKEVVRSALNSVGKAGGLGEHIRCVVSVQMLTEGWDTRTVTHICGYRAFSTQLLCEQVTGRALRRSNYDNYDTEGRLVAEYAEVIGVPFEFMPTKGQDVSSPPKPRYEVKSVHGRQMYRVDFPNVASYLTEHGSNRFRLDKTRVIRWVPDGVAQTELSGSVGGTTTLKAYEQMRAQQAQTRLAAELVTRWCTHLDETGNSWRARRRYLFHDAIRIVSQWAELANVIAADWNTIGSANLAQATKEIADACLPADATADRVAATFGYPNLLDTSGISFETSLVDRHVAKHSELSAAACHSEFEAALAWQLDNHPDVRGWARNFRLGWEIPCLWEGAWHHYEPDFVVRLFGEREDESAVHLIIECKGITDDRSERKKQATTEKWIPAVESSAQLPRWLRSWSFVELANKDRMTADLNIAIAEVRSAHTQTSHPKPVELHIPQQGAA